MEIFIRFPTIVENFMKIVRSSYERFRRLQKTLKIREDLKGGGEFKREGVRSE